MLQELERVGYFWERAKASAKKGTGGQRVPVDALCSRTGDKG